MASTWPASATVMGRMVTPAGFIAGVQPGSAASGPARGEWRRRRPGAVIAVPARRRVAGGGQDRAGDRVQLPDLLGRERVEQGPADLLDVAGAAATSTAYPSSVSSASWP